MTVIAGPGAAEIAHKIRGLLRLGLRKEQISLGFLRDLTIPFAALRARLTISLRAFQPSTLSDLFLASDAVFGAEEREDIARRLRMVASRSRTLSAPGSRHA